MKDEVKIGMTSVCTMSQEESLQLAAAAWCGEKTKHKVMDPELAKEFARILQREVNGRLLRERIIKKGLLSTQGVRAAREYEKLTGESLCQWVEVLAKEKANSKQLKLMEDATKVYNITKGTPLRFPPEAIIHMEIGEDRKTFNPGDADGNEATDR